MGVRRIIGLGVPGLVAILVAGGLVMPRTFSVERQAVVRAPVETVYALASDLTKHPLWNARAARDATMRFSFPGEVHSGPGAVYEWTSEQNGAGRCTVKSAEPNKSLTVFVTLEGKGSGEATWRFESSGNQTTVSRSFRAEIPVPVLGSWIRLFLRPEERLGADFEQELQLFKKAAEGAAFSK